MAYIYFDCETIGHSAAGDYILPPNLDAITAAKNLKDPEKVAADIAARRAAAEAEYQSSLSRAALDWNLSRIVALAWAFEDGDPHVMLCRDETEETAALTAFWRVIPYQTLVGFCSRTFDTPTLIQRSRLLGVKVPHLNLSRWGKGDVVDLRDELTFGDARYEALMPRSLKAFAHRFGIPFDDEIVGKEIAALHAADDWAGITAHVTSDVLLTRALARRIGVGA